MTENGLSASHAEKLADALAPTVETQAVVLVGAVAPEGTAAAAFPESYVAVSSLESITAFGAELPVSGLLKQAVHTLSLPVLSFEDSILLQRLLEHNASLSNMNLPGPISLPMRQIRTREITELALVQVGAMPKNPPLPVTCRQLKPISGHLSLAL